MEGTTTRTGHVSKETDMTTLVLDNPDLLAQSAALETAPLIAAVTADTPASRIDSDSTMVSTNTG